MKKELLEKLKGQTIKTKLYNKKFDVKVTDIIEDEYEESDYLEGSYTKEELLELVESLGGTTKQYKVYGQLSKSDAKKVKKLSDLAKLEFIGSCSGGYYPSTDWSNPILLEIFKDGDEPQY